MRNNENRGFNFDNNAYTQKNKKRNLPMYKFYDIHMRESIKEI